MTTPAVIESVSLKTIADIFSVHPRTILRAITGDFNIYWTEDVNDMAIKIDDLVRVYTIQEGALLRVIEGRDTLMTPTASAELIGIPGRTFRYQRFPAIRAVGSKRGGTVRYLRSKMIHQKIARED